MIACCVGLRENRRDEFYKFEFCGHDDAFLYHSTVSFFVFLLPRLRIHKSALLQ